MILILLAGDIETCPGPGPKYTCPTCSKTIRKNQKFGCCDTCNSRCHMKCLTDILIERMESLFCSLCRVEDLAGVESASFINDNFRCFLGSRGIKIVHQNINGIIGKIDKLRLLVADSKQQIGIFSITETHINDTVKNSDLNIPGYTIERRDRENGPHGGVVLYIRDDLTYQRRTELEVAGLECIWIEILIPNTKSVLLAAMYKPPDNSKYLDENFLEKLDNMLSTITIENKESIITGDLNCDYLLPRDHADIKFSFSSNGFKQVINEPKRTTQNSKTLIDVIMTTNPTKVSKKIVKDSHHTWNNFFIFFFF